MPSNQKKKQQVRTTHTPSGVGSLGTSWLVDKIVHTLNLPLQ